MIVLYDNPVSSNALKVRFALAELELSYRRETIPIARPRPAAYLRRNPLGGIPALEDGDLFVTESHTILRYLATRERRDDLYPADPRHRAKVDEFLDRFATGLRGELFRHEAVALGYVYERGFDAVPRDPAAAERVAAEIAPSLRLLDALVTPRGAVLARFTIADCSLGAILFRTTVTGLDLGAYPRLLGLREALLARPAWPRAGAVV